MNDLNMDTLIETNNRLHRRCQRAESLVFKYRRRYAAVCRQSLLMDAADRCLRAAHSASEIYFSQLYSRKCWLCRLTRFLFWR